MAGHQHSNVASLAIKRTTTTAEASIEQSPVERARAGDEHAQAELYRQHAPVVVRRLAHACGDPELARDVTQDAFITAFDRLSGFRGDAGFGTWLHGIAFNHLRDRRKKQGREHSLWTRLRRQPPALVASLEEKVASRSAIEQLDRALRELPPKLRDAFVLRVVEQLSLEEAAQILGARTATVSYRARRAETLVRAHFGEGES